MRLLKIIVNIIGELFMKTIRIKTLFFSLLCSAAISSIIFSSEKNLLEKNAKLSALTVLNPAQYSTTVRPSRKTQFDKQENKKLIEQQTSNVKDLVYVADKENQTMLELLLSQEGMNINQRDHNGSTALIRSTSQGLTKAIMLLIRNKANVDHQCYENGPTPLTIAAFYGYSGITALLLAGRANIGKTIMYGRTALMFATGHGHLEIVKQFLTRKADAGKCDDNGYTALKFAQENSHPEIVKLLTDDEN